MTTKTKGEKPTISNNAEVDSSTNKNIPQSQSSGKGFQTILIIITLILSLSAIGLSIFSIKMQKLQNASVKQLKKSIIDKRFSEDNQIQDFAKKLNQNLKKVDTKIDSLENNLNAIQVQKSGDNKTWQLQRAAYFISQAQISAHWEKNPKVVKSLLQTADNILRDLKDTKLIGVRQSLHNEIAALDAIPSIDTIGLISQLNAIANQIPSLNLKHAGNNDLPEAKTPPKKESSWKTALNESYHALSKLVIIRRNTQTYLPLLSKEEQNLVVAKIQMDLKQAEWSVLRQKSSFYKFFITQAIKDIQLYFTIDDKTKNLLSSLDELQKKNINIKMPTIESSYQQLKALKSSKAIITSVKGEQA